MFSPIRNFITYMQKNASGSVIFGSSTKVTTRNTLDDKEMEQTNDTNSISSSGGSSNDHLLRSIESDKIKEHDDTDIEEKPRLKENETPDTTSADAGAATAIENNMTKRSLDFYDDAMDIEMQIKSSVMFKKSPVTNGMGDESELLVPTTLANVKQSIYPPDNMHEEDGIGSDHELADFRLDAATTMASKRAQCLLEDGCSMGSTVDAATGGEDTAEEFNTEDDENTEERFLDYNTEGIELYPNGEIIVLNDVDLNSSVASDALSEDPLAIDEFTQATATCSQISVSTPTRETNSSTNTLDSNEEEGSMHTDLLWIDIDAIKSNSEKDLKEDMLLIGMPQKRPALNSIAKTMTEQSTDGNVNTGVTTPTQKSPSEENVEEFRSDGSDSGLGIETSTLQTTLLSGADTSSVSTSSSSVIQTLHLPEHTTTLETLHCNTLASVKVAHMDSSTVACSAAPLRSNLKRRLEVANEDVMLSASPTVDMVTTASGAAAASTDGSVQKKPKRSINFDAVQVYYFPRQQGFGCVPSAGGCTLGMAATHVSTKTLSLAEHAAELRRAHRLQLQEINPRGSSSDDSEESEEDYLSEGSGSDLDAESNGFLQPVPPKQRRALLKAAGVRKIDAGEKVECRDIRNSREVCGCSCREFCDPDTCACNQAGIKCQVDRAMFPCGCSRDACGNTVGRVEFNPQRVRVHFIHTIMRLEMENRQQQNPSLVTTAGDNGAIGAGVLSYGLSLSSSSSSPSTSATTGAASTANNATMQTNVQLPSNFYGIQTHSNYSSGYASPVYSTEPTPAANYYQPQSSTMHHYNGSEMQPLHGAQSQYPIDSLSTNLFASSTTTSPSYAELMPSYGNVNTASSNVYQSHQSLAANYSNTNVTAYTSYQHQAADDTVIATPPTTYSSCAVPSVPPYGSATTTAAHYDSECNIMLETTTAPSCIPLIGGEVTIDGDGVGDNDANLSSGIGVDTPGGGGGGSFIDLNTPIVNATRLSQINDLLQHNRNTTAALVAVSQSTNCMIMSCSPAPLISSASSMCSGGSDLTTTTATTAASIDTPPIEEFAQKSCLLMDNDDLPAPLQPAPIVTVLESENATKTPSFAALSCDNDHDHNHNHNDGDCKYQTVCTNSSIIAVSVAETTTIPSESVLTTASSTAND